MRYYKADLKFGLLGGRRRREFLAQLNELDRALLRKADRPHGCDILDLVSAGRPFINRHGAKQFASRRQVLESVEKLLKLKALKIGGE